VADRLVDLSGERPWRRFGTSYRWRMVLTVRLSMPNRSPNSQVATPATRPGSAPGARRHRAGVPVQVWAGRQPGPWAFPVRATRRCPPCGDDSGLDQPTQNVRPPLRPLAALALAGRRQPPALFSRRNSWATVNNSTETIAGCARTRERTIRSGADRRKRVTWPAAVRAVPHRPEQHQRSADAQLNNRALLVNDPKDIGEAGRPADQSRL